MILYAEKSFMMAAHNIPRGNKTVFVVMSYFALRSANYDITTEHPFCIICQISADQICVKYRLV